MYLFPTFCLGPFMHLRSQVRSTNTMSFYFQVSSHGSGGGELCRVPALRVADFADGLYVRQAMQSWSEKQKALLLWKTQPGCLCFLGLTPSDGVWRGVSLLAVLAHSPCVQEESGPYPPLPTATSFTADSTAPLTDRRGLSPRPLCLGGPVSCIG